MLSAASLLLVLVSAVETASHKSKEANSKNKGVIRPAISDLNSQFKVIKPFIEKPFIPQEVDRLALEEPKRKNFDDTLMTKAMLVGPTPSKGGADENPTMYNTVIQSRPTAIMHPSPQPTKYSVSHQAAAAFGVPQNEIVSPAPAPLTPGAYSIPVKIQGGPANDPTLSGYETPNFIHKGEKQIGGNGLSPGETFTSADPHVQMQDEVKHNIESFISQFDNTKDKADKIKILLDGKHRLAAEAKALTAKTQEDIQDLLKAKEVALLMRNIIAKYEVKIKNNQVTQFKLADTVEIRNILRDKLHRELQGFRTSGSEFAELEKVNPEDIQKVIHTIKNKLGA